MKKLITVAILGLTALSDGWAQGTVDFRNGGVTFPTAGQDRKAYRGAVGNGTGLTGTNYVASLVYASSAAGLQGSAGTIAGRTFAFRAATTTSPGTWIIPVGASPTFTLAGVNIGDTTTLQVRVWDSTRFGSFAEALGGSGETGASDPFQYTVPAAGSTPDKYYIDGLRAFAVVVVPEPSTIALGLLGAASLLFLRRRK